MAGKHYYPTALVRLHVRLNDVGQSNPDELILLEFPPVELQVTVNHWNEADTIDVTVDYEDFPIDPRIVRGITVEAFIANQEAGIDPHFWEKESASPERMREWWVFAGVVDEISNAFDTEDGRRTKLRGRDYTAYFLDSQMPSEPIAYVRGGRKRTLAEILEEIIRDRVETRDLELVVADGIPDLYPADYKDHGTDVELGKRHKRRGETVWEAMQDLAQEAGLIVYVELDRVVLRAPHTIFLREGMDPDNFYRWVLGQNVKAVEPKRQMGRQQQINVRVISYLPGEGKTLTATAPREPQAADRIPARRLLLDPTRGRREFTPEERDALREADRSGELTGGEPPREVHVRTYQFRGIASQTQLQRIADDLYELHIYHDLELEFETDDLEDSDGDSVLQLRFGDPLVFDADEGFRSILALSAAEQTERLIAKGYPREAAEAFATALNQLSVPFYVHAVDHHFRTGDGGGYALKVAARGRKQVEATDLPDVARLRQIEAGQA